MAKTQEVCANCEFSVCGYPIGGTFADITIYCAESDKPVKVNQSDTCDKFERYAGADYDADKMGGWNNSDMAGSHE